MTNNLKLVGEPEAPMYPRTNIQMGPPGAGFAIQILLADDIAITKAFNGQAEAELCNLLVDRRKQARQQAEMVRDIERTKNRQ